MLVVLYILIITGIPGAILSIPVMKYLREMKAAQADPKAHSQVF